MIKSKLIILLVTASVIAGCSKSDFLKKKPKKSLLVPTTVEHLQALLDMDGFMNGLDGQGLTPHIGESASDNVYVLDDDFNASMRPQMQNYYTWNEYPYEGVQVLDWEYPYRAILAANVVINKIDEFKNSVSDYALLDGLSAQAYFHQAHLYYQLAQIFMKAYDRNKANMLSGLPLRIEDDINEKLSVASMEETYKFILDRLKQSVPYLSTSNNHKHRPSKQAAYGLLARVYLFMGEFEYAREYADSCLLIQSELYDYNLATVGPAPFATVSDLMHPVETEVIFNCNMLSDPTQGFSTSYMFGLIDTVLYSSYAANDLRKVLYYEKRPVGYRFVGSYAEQPAIHFSGLAVDEIYLIRSECHIRLGEIDKGIADLNLLRKYRFKTDGYVPLPIMAKEEALESLMNERRKELVFRGLRWPDLKRMSLMGRETLLQRNINGERYQPKVKMADFSWPFPQEVLL